MEAQKVLIIGAGPGGLTTLKTIIESSNRYATQPLEAILVEAESEIGGTFRYRRYQSAELVSSRQLTAYSDYRIPRSNTGVHGDHISLIDYVEYLKVSRSARSQQGSAEAL